MDFVCSPGVKSNKSLSFDGADFKKISYSNHPHRGTTLGKLREGPVAICDYKLETGHVEIFSNEIWIEQPPFPEIFTFYSYYSTTTYNNVLYVFGE